MNTELYVNLEKHWNKNQYKYYRKQDLKFSGKEECGEIYTEEYFSKNMQGELADGLLELLINYHDNSYEILNYLRRFKIIKFYEEFLSKLDILVKELVFSKGELYDLGSYYAKECTDEELIKLGLLLLKFNDDESSLNILKVFSTHNDFIFYSLEAIKGYKKCNSIIFDIAKKTVGYGKIISMSQVEPLTEEIKTWIVGDGIKNIFLEEFLVAISFNKVDYYDYFFEGEKTSKKYKILTRNLLLFYELKETFVNNISIDLIELYCNYFESYKYNFDNIYVMCALLSLFYKVEGESSLIDVLNLSKEEEKYIDDEIEKFVQNDFKNIIEETIDINRIEINKIIDVATALDINLSFDRLLLRLKNNPFEVSVYNYIMSYGNKEDKNSLIEFAKDELSFEKIITTKEIITEDELSLEYVEDYCFLLIIAYMDKGYKEFIKLNLMGLKARYVKTKIEALNNLKIMREKLANSDIEKIEAVSKEENDVYQKRGLYAFLTSLKEDSSNVKKVNIDKYKVIRHSKDVYLTNIFLEEYENKEIMNFTKELNTDDIVYLTVDKCGNENDRILILNGEGYILGCVRSDENYILKNLIDWGKIIYGEIINISEGYREIEIALYLSYEDVIREVSNAFNMVIKNPRGYLN